MKHLILILPLFLFLTSCHPHIHETDTMSERGPDSIYAAYLNLARTLPDSLGKIGPYIAVARDSSTSFEILDSPFLAIGKLIDNTQTFAISCINKNDSACLNIYRDDNDNWNLVGLYYIPYEVQFVKFINADSDGRTNEIILSGTGNANGNRQHDVYIYDPHRGILGYAGGFFTCDEDFDQKIGGYKIDHTHNTIMVDYEGSNAGTSKSLFLWREDSLVLLRDVTISVEENHRQLEYMVHQDTSFSGSLTTIFSERDDQNNSPHHKKYWDHFFDLK